LSSSKTTDGIGPLITIYVRSYNTKYANTFWRGGVAQEEGRPHYCFLFLFYLFRRYLWRELIWHS